jgi:hypothetical protein
MQHYVRFDKKNENSLIIKFEDGKRTYIALPPVAEGCDIINFGDKLNEGYTHNFSGFVIMTGTDRRYLYHEGCLIDQIKRKR